MKTLYGYLILFISFSGLLYLKHSGSNIAPVSQRYFNTNTNIDFKIRKRIAKLEAVVDSLTVQNLELQAGESDSPMDKIPLLSPTPQVSSVESQHNKIKKNVLINELSRHVGNLIESFKLGNAIKNGIQTNFGMRSSMVIIILQNL